MSDHMTQAKIGDTREMNGRIWRLYEIELEGEKWMDIGPTPAPADSRQALLYAASSVQTRLMVDGDREAGKIVAELCNELAALSTTSTAEQAGASGEVAGLIERAQEVAGRMGARLDVDPAKVAAFPAPSPGGGDAPVAWREIDPMIDPLGCLPWMVCRKHPSASYGPALAFIDAGGTWRVAGSPGGMAPLAWMPTHIMAPPSIWATHPTPATPAGEELREKFARIVDPHAFLSMEDAGDAMVSEMVSQSRKDAYRKADRLLAVARGEPDAILAALQPQAEGGSR